MAATGLITGDFFGGGFSTFCNHPFFGIPDTDESLASPEMIIGAGKGLPARSKGQKAHGDESHEMSHGVPPWRVVMDILQSEKTQITFYPLDPPRCQKLIA
jgi:hypothetical protein